MNRKISRKQYGSLCVTLTALLTLLMLSGCGLESGMDTDEGRDAVMGSAASGPASAEAMGSTDAQKNAYDLLGLINMDMINNSTNIYWDDWGSEDDSDSDGDDKTGDGDQIVQTRLDLINEDEEEKRLDIDLKGADEVSPIDVTDEYLYYIRSYENNVDEYDALWRAPITKKDGFDEVRLDEEEYLFSEGCIDEVFATDRFLYVNLEEEEGYRYAIYDIRSHKWVGMGEDAPKSDDSRELDYSWWGATESGGILCSLPDTETGHYHVYLEDQKSHTFQKRMEAADHLYIQYSTKCLFMTDGYSVQLCRDGKTKECLSEKVLDAKLKEILERWTNESREWDYSKWLWELKVLYLTREGKLLMVFGVTDQEKAIQRFNDYEGNSFYDDIVLSCPVSELFAGHPEDSLEEMTIADAYQILEKDRGEGGSFTEYVKSPEEDNLAPYDRVDWEAYRECLTEEEYQALEGFLPVFRDGKKFTLIWWERGVKDSKEYETGLTFRRLCEDWNNVWGMDYGIEGIALADLFHTGELDLILTGDWGDAGLFFHREKGKIYCFGFPDYVAIAGIYKNGIIEFGIDADGYGHSTNYVRISHDKAEEGSQSEESVPGQWPGLDRDAAVFWESVGNSLFEEFEPLARIEYDQQTEADDGIEQISPRLVKEYDIGGQLVSKQEMENWQKEHLKDKVAVMKGKKKK